LERKRRLRELITSPGPALYVDHVAGTGVDLFEAVCANDMEGIVAKLASSITGIRKRPPHVTPKTRLVFPPGKRTSKQRLRHARLKSLTGLYCRCSRFAGASGSRRPSGTSGSAE